MINHPDFSKLKLDTTGEASSREAWEEAFRYSAGQKPESYDWTTNEQIKVKAI